jgi:hypothetical protein
MATTDASAASPFRIKAEDEVDLVLETRDGRVAGFAIKTGTTIRPRPERPPPAARSPGRPVHRRLRPQPRKLAYRKESGGSFG